MRECSTKRTVIIEDKFIFPSGGNIEATQGKLLKLMSFVVHTILLELRQMQFKNISK